METKTDDRPVVLTGHYGSGKSELAVNLALKLSRDAGHIAVVDLDIANPYFRSREAADRLKRHGVRLVGNAYGYDITQDLPALSSSIKQYLGSPDFKCIVDVGGNESGARVLNQFSDVLREKDAKLFIVVNVFRPETDTVSKTISMIKSIEAETGQFISGILNNSNMLRKTKPHHISYGFNMLLEVSKQTGIPIVASCACEDLCGEISGSCGSLMPIEILMRPGWLDM